MQFYPNPATKCFYNILKHANLTLDVPVKILTEYPSEDDTPCVSMIDTPSGTVPDKRIYYRYGTLPDTHPFYDPDNPNVEYLVEKVLRTTSHGVITLHIHANSKDEKDSLVFQVNQAIDMAFMGNYHQCMNYKDGICFTTGETCDATTVVNTYSYSEMCPYLDIDDITNTLYRNPYDAFYDAGLRAVEVQLPQSLDETMIVPEVYHSSIMITYLSDHEFVTPTSPAFAFQDKSTSDIL